MVHARSVCSVEFSVDRCTTKPATKFVASTHSHLSLEEKNGFLSSDSVFHRRQISIRGNQREAIEATFGFEITKATTSRTTTTTTTTTTMAVSMAMMMFWMVLLVPQLLMAASSAVGVVEAFLPPRPSKSTGAAVFVGEGRQLSPFIRWASSSSSNSPTSSSTTDESSTTTTTTTTTTAPLGTGTATSAVASTPEQRAAKAKQTWSTIALQPMMKQGNNKGSSGVTQKVVELSLASPEVSTVYNPDLFHEFLTTIRGTYYINGLASCQVGDRLLHPFEAHGVVKSLVFNGKGQLTFTNRLIETELNRREADEQQVLARGVMSTQYDSNSLLGVIGNAFSPTDRDTANLVANLWPLPNTHGSTMEPLLITCTDNGEPHVLDPLTLETKGKLIDVVPKLKSVLLGNEKKNKKVKFLAHTRYDERRERFIMCTNHMDIPGDGDHFQGNSTYEFLEFDSNFDLVTSRTVTTRFMVAHDWVITDHYYIIPQNPAKLVWPDLFQFMIGTTVGTDIFEMEHDVHGAFLLVPRHDPNEPVHRVESDAFFNLFHFGPCYEEDEKEVILHGAVFDSYKFGGEMGFDGQSQQFDPVGWATKTNPKDDNRLNAPAPRLDKFVLDLETFTLKERRRIPIIDPRTGQDVPVDMPQFNNGVGSGGDGKKCRYSYFLGACRPEGWFPFRSIVKTDLQTGQAWNWDAGDGQVVSEPMFVPRQPTFEVGGDDNTIQTEPETEEDDGFVLSIVHNAEDQTCRIMIWDSQRFGEGPIAESKLGDLMPWCVHGSWYPGYNP